LSKRRFDLFTKFTDLGLGSARVPASSDWSKQTENFSNATWCLFLFSPPASKAPQRILAKGPLVCQTPSGQALAFVLPDRDQMAVLKEAAGISTQHLRKKFSLFITGNWTQFC
jgi:hypothetical protein